QPGLENFGFQRSNFFVPDDLFTIQSRDRVLPRQMFLRNQWPEVAHDWTHIAMSQLEPCPGKRIGKLVRMLVEPARNFFVSRIKTQREVCGQHGWCMLL